MSLISNRVVSISVCRARLADRRLATLWGAALVLGALPVVAPAQTNPLPSRVEPLAIDSGLLRHVGDRPAVIWSEVVHVPGGLWLRLAFETAILAEDPRGGPGSQLVITSVRDGGRQILDATTIRQWQLTSAYFNGEALLVELLAAPNGRANRVVIREVTVGEFDDGVLTSRCGPTDDRVLSNDPRAGRALPVGCTAWIFDDAACCLLTAGHCTGSLQVIEFNVPLSNADGSLNHPPPEDQYAVDPSSLQGNGGQGVGNDWAYFGCFPNSITGLTPFEAQGERYVLADRPPPVRGQPIRITGYGVMEPRNHPWNQVQKTHAGPYWAFDTDDAFYSRVQYQTDTTGGNSGSPIIDDETGLAIGIHTHGGCSDTSGNSGTGSNHAGLREALATPRGVCAEFGLAFIYPDGRPQIIAPSGGTTMRVEVRARGRVLPRPGTGRLHYDLGGGFVDVAMNEISENLYDAVFPAAACGSTVRYYVSAESTAGDRYTDPADAPGSTYAALSADGFDVLFADDFEQDLGWTVQNENLATGAWVRAIPAGGGGTGDPTDDYDGSGRCFVTGNAVSEDVDGGPTRLISPRLDLSAANEPRVRYARWFSNDDRDADRLVVEISNNDGASWTLVESVPHTVGWIDRSVRVADFVAPTAQVRLRFSAADNPNNSLTEAAIDAFAVSTVRCGCDPCDANCDGSVNASDIESFIDLLFGGGSGCSGCAGDTNGDGGVNSSDIEGFIACLFAP